MARDSSSRNDLQVLLDQLVRRHNADIGIAGGERIGALRRDPKIEVEKAALRAVRHAPDQRHSIQIADCTDAQPRRVVGVQFFSLTTKDWEMAAGECSGVSRSEERR